MKNTRRLGRTTVALIVLTAGISIMVCWGFVSVIDPYGLYGSKRISGLNYYKTELSDRLRTVKPRFVSHQRPKSVIFGSSSAEAGFNPTHPSWPQPAYNMAYSAGRLPETLESIRFATAFGMKHALIVLDFTNFHADTPKGQLDLRNFDAYHWGWFGNSSLFLDEMKVSIGQDAIIDAWKTIIKQQGKIRARDRVERLEENGMRPEAFSAYTISRLGQSEAFRRKILHRMTQTWFFEPCREWRLQNEAGEQPGLAALREIAAYVRAHDIDARFIIPPVHPSVLVAMKSVGIFEKYEEWKSALVSQLASEARTSGKSQFRLYDFGVVSDVTREPVPSRDSSKVMTKYFDPLHFTPLIGAMVFDKVYSGTIVGQDVSFGRTLTESSILRHLQEQRVRLDELPEKDELFDRFVAPNMEASIKWRSKPQGCSKKIAEGKQ